MQYSQVKEGLRVRTCPQLLEMPNLVVKPADRLRARQPNKEGNIITRVPKHGGDLWWIVHDDTSMAPYHFSELNPI
jgi:hypothetical protein